MSDVSKLLERIDGTIAAAKEKVRQQQPPLLQDYTERQKRLQGFEQTRDQVRAIAKPRLEALARLFGYGVAPARSVSAWRERRLASASARATADPQRSR